MYGIIEIGGHQYQVRPGAVLDVEKLDVKEGLLIDLENVLYIGGETPRIGVPTVEGAKVQAKVIKHARGKKFPVFQKSPGKWEKRRGHKQSYTSLLITEIHDGKGQLAKIGSEEKNYEKYLKETSTN